MDILLQDLRSSFRRLRRRPLFAVIAVLTIALGIGANAAIFSVVHGVLRAPLPMPDEDELIALWKYDPARDFDHFPILFEEFRRWHDENRSFTALAAVVSEGTWRLPMAPLEPDGAPSLVTVAPVSSDFFAVAGVLPERGRAFERADEAAAEVRPVVLAHAFWTRRLGADPDALGRVLTVDGRPHRVIGIAAPGFDFPLGVELWRCLDEETRVELEALGRLAPGTTREAAREEIEAIAQRFADEESPFLRDKVVVATPLLESLVGDVRGALLVLLATVGVLLLIAAANVANLLLVETAARRRQLMIRTALGAPRRRLVRQLLTESLVVGTLGGLVGLGLAHAGVRVLTVLRPAALTRIDEIGLHPPVLGFAFVLTLVVTVAFGLVPALRGSRDGSTATLKVGEAGIERPASRLMRSLVVAETALALVLLIAAGLLLRSFAADTPTGFRP